MISEGITLYLIIFSALIVLASPFPIWRNVFELIYLIIKAPRVSIIKKVRSLIYLAKSIVVLFLKSIFWIIDGVFFNTNKVKGPVIIVGSPRSGTTYLHRVLDKHDDFHTLTYMQMRFPSETLWKLSDLFKLTKLIQNINYWPSNKNGILASKLHKHTFGDKEEIGMFLEEIMMSHFFLYRRFPFSKVALSIGNIDNLNSSQHSKLLRGVDGLFRRSMHYGKNKDKTILIKENESTIFLKKMLDFYPATKFIFIYRPSAESFSSYQNLSIVSTKVKTGIDPRNIDGWQEENNAFRIKEMNNFLEFYKSLPKEKKILISYKKLSVNPEKEVSSILDWLNIKIGKNYKNLLLDENEKQLKRNKDYENESYTIYGAEEYDDFFQTELEKT